MFILKTQHGQFYTGRAAEYWLDGKRTSAYPFSTENAAQYRAEMFNKWTSIHGHVFQVVPMLEEVA